MAYRHKAQKMECKAKGGRVYYEGGQSNVAKEAAERKHGGKIPDKKSAPRLDKRARGGGVGADKHPFSSAAHKGGGGSDKSPFSSAHSKGK